MKLVVELETRFNSECHSTLVEEHCNSTARMRHSSEVLDLI
jgi:hypothetical protein